MLLTSSGSTFLGVILTLAVLCLYIDEKSNFIISILFEQLGRFKGKLTKEQNNIKTRREKFENSENYLFIKNSLKSDSITDQSRNHAISIDYEYQLGTQESQIDLSTYYSKMDLIKKTNEQIRAPFCTLIFGLIIFVLNELIPVFQNPTPIIVGIWVFTLIFAIYWISVWIAFMVRSLKENHSENKQSFWVKIENQVTIYGASILKILMGLSIVTIFFLFFSEQISGDIFGIVLFFIVTLLLITAIGINRLRKCNVKGEYSIMHVIGHIMAFFTYSGLVSVLYVLFGNNFGHKLFSNEILQTFTDSNIIGLVICIIALLNGIVCPFLFPYLRYKQPYDEGIKNIRKCNSALTVAITHFETSFTEFSKDYMKQEMLRQNKKETDGN